MQYCRWYNSPLRQPQIAVSDVDGLIGFYNSGAVCLLRGTDWIFIVQVKFVFRRISKIAKSDY